MSPVAMMTAADVARIIRARTVHTVYRLARTGKLPYYRPLNQMLFDPSDVAVFIERTKVKVND